MSGQFKAILAKELLNLRYRPEIDGLRALAVVPVILFHAGFELFGGGFIGVDVFFVISGFLITSIIHKEMDGGNFSLVGFYERRARRILPALFLVILVCAPFASAWFMPRDMKDFAQSMVAVSTFSSNFLFWIESGYFDTAAELKPLLHTWSLAVEEQYYILFPLFLLAIWRFGTRWVLAALVIISLMSFSFAHWSSLNNSSAAFYLLPSRGWELLVGSMVAMYLRRYEKHSVHKADQFGSALGFVLITYAIFAFDRHTPFPSAYTLVPTIGTALVIVFAVKGTLVHTLLSMRVLVGIGLVSYSAYLWHQPLLAFTRYRMLTEPSAALLLSLCLMSFLLAYVSWKFVEKPFRARRSVSRYRLFGVSLAAVLSFVSAGLYGQFSIEPVTQVILEDAEIQIPQTFTGLTLDGQNCSFPDFADRPPCTFHGASSTSLKIAVLGDSHARVLTEAIHERSDAYTDFVDLSSSGCPFLPGMSVFEGHQISECTVAYQTVRSDYINQLGNDFVVVLAARLPLYRSGERFDNGIGGVEKKIRILAANQFGDDLLTRQTDFDRSLVGAIEFLTGSGRTVIVVLPNHVNGWDPIVRALRLRDVATGVQELQRMLAIPIANVHSETRHVEAILENLASANENIHLIRPNSITCDSDRQECYAIRSGEFLFSDEDHLSIHANRMLANDIFNLIRNNLQPTP